MMLIGQEFDDRSQWGIYIQATHGAAVRCRTWCIGLSLYAEISGFHTHWDRCFRTWASGRSAQQRCYPGLAPFHPWRSWFLRSGGGLGNWACARWLQRTFCCCSSFTIEGSINLGCVANVSNEQITE